jgi:thiamine-phosphate pyrophosphorylase
VRHAIKGGASAVLVSPIFVTKGKGAPRGVEAITRARELVGAAPGAPRVLVYALGGVDARNVGACRAAGADGVAAIRALYDGDAAALGAAFAGATA